MLDKIKEQMKKHIVFTICVCISVGIIITILIGYIAPFIEQWDNVTIMAVLTIAVTLCNGVIPSVTAIHIYKRERIDANIQKLCMKTDISINTIYNGMVTFSAWIENIGSGSFETHITNLYIDKGKETIVDDGKIVFYDFPELLKHRAQGKDYDCVLKIKCMNDEVAYPDKKEISQTYSNEYEDFGYQRELKHLSRESVQFLLPGECFSEDIVVRLKSGVYRGIMVVTTKTEGCECSCSSKQFYVPEYKYEEKSVEVSSERVANS